MQTTITLNTVSSTSYGFSEVDLDQITNNIYIGDKHAAKNKQLLRQLGIKAILVAGQELLCPHPEQFQYLQLPVRDSEKEKINSYFENVCQFIDKNVQKRGKVLVHCAYGISRSSTVVIAYLMKKLKISYSEAYSYVRRKRPNARPNRGFEEQLKLWGQTLKKNQ